MLNIPDKIKRLFLDDSILKNIRIRFPNGEHRDITAYDLEEESFTFTESLCSQERLKFGLSEAAVVQFVTKGVGNIKGMEIHCQVEIDISSLDDEFISEYGHTSADIPFPFYPVTLGFFTVKSCPKDSIADTESRSVKAYDKLTSQSLDYDKTEHFNNYLKSKPVCVPQTVYTLERMMLQDFNIGHERVKTPVEYSYLGDENILYEGIVLSVDGSKDTNFEVWTQTYTFKNIESAEVYDVIFSTVGLFAGKHGLLKFYQDREGFKLGTNDYWWLDHGLELALTDINSNTIVFTEYDSVDDVLSIFGCGNIAEMKFTIVSSINLAWHDEYGGIDDLYSYIKDEDRETMLASISIQSLSLYDIERKAIPPVLTSCTLRNVLNAVFEINGTFATINRESGMLEEREVGSFGLYPSETLYPSDDLYPSDTTEAVPMGLYSHAVHDDSEIKPYGKIIAHYKTTDAEGYTIDAEYEHVFNENGITYNLNSNWILQNCIFTEEEVAALCSYMEERIQHITYTAGTVTAKGLPWIEAGDTLLILTKKSGFEMIALRRTMSGIQGLVDNIEAKGEG